MGKIVLPKEDSIRKALEDKLAEYQGRLERIRARKPDIGLEELNKMTSSGYKELILKRLLEKGEVDTGTLLTELQQTEGFVDRDNYENAAFVVGDYCENGGRNIHGGTGFPVGERRKSWEREKQEMYEQFSKTL